MTPDQALYAKAFAAYRALCELEDELDALTAAGQSPHAASTFNELRCLRSRWIDDTGRKIDRALQGAPA